MIFIDNYPYYVDKSSYADKPNSPANYGRGLTGQPLVVESGIFTQEYVITLNVSQMEYEQLKNSYVNCHTIPTYLDFQDERGMWFDPTTGTNTKNHIFSTGAWFQALSEAKPTEQLFDPFMNAYYSGYQSPQKRFTCLVHLITKAKVLY